MSKVVVKKWGAERWLHNANDYCMKVLELKPGFQSSLHYHKVKRETFLVVSGKVKLEVVSNHRIGHDHRKDVYLWPYQHYTLDPYVPHRFTAIGGPAVIVEASTKHSDSDVVRLEESCELRP